MNEYGLEFSKERTVDTSRGARTLKKADPTEEFWKAWRENKDTLKKQGYSVSQYEGKWSVCVWGTPNLVVEEIIPEIKPIKEINYGERTPFKHQIEGIEFLLSHPRTILADDMGLGKTLESLVAANCFGLPIHVICPKTLVDNWNIEAKAANVKLSGLYPWSKLPKKIDGEYFLIVDESHFAQAGKRTLRGKTFLELTEKAKGCYCLTGTPMKNGRPINLLPLLQATKHPIAKDVTYYHRHYCDAHATRFTRWDCSGAAHLDELHAQLKTIMLRRKKEECLDLPEKTRIFREAELSESAKKIYNDTLNRLKYEYETRISQNLISSEGEALVMLTHCRMAGSIAKVETALELAEEVLAQEHAVVLFTEFIESANMLHEKLGGLILTGQTQNRQSLIEAFQSGKEKVFVLTKAGGLGITLTASSMAIMVDRPWTPGDAVQIEDRLFRIGQKNAVTSIWIQHGIDSHVDGILQEKEKNITQVLEGERRIMSGKSMKPDELLRIIFNHET
jgi:SNF2 family DNA or RNA helicase